MKVAVIQMSSGADKQKNILKAEALLRKAVANKATFICLPEVFNFRSKRDLKAMKCDVAETLQGSTLQRMATFAREHQVYICAGSIYERRAQYAKLSNTSACFNARGARVAVYRKRNLFKACLDDRRISEADMFVKGSKTVVVNVEKYKMGISICYDLRFPALYEMYKKQGVEVLCIPSAFTKKTGQAHWEVLLRARAIENRCYVLAPNQIGGDGTVVEAYGHSMIINPWGEIIAKAKKNKEDIIYAELKKAELKKVKEILPL